LEKVLQNKNVIDVAFFVLTDTQWKYGKLYELLAQNPRFKPVIVVCPFWLREFKALRMALLQRTYDFFVNKGYNVLNTYDEQSGQWVNLKETLHPDIIFWAFPYEKQTKDEYFITNFPDSLSCYVPYFFGTFGENWTFDLKFHNLLWIFFCETSFHKEVCTKMQRMKGLNVFVSGYPATDVYIDKINNPYFPWKKTEGNRLKVIWAPHHSIAKSGYSTFLINCDTMLYIAKKYSSEIQFVVKPHPVLKSSLYALKDWGQEKTDKYFESWNDLPNGQVWESDYENLFLTSDALIHDCSSFTIEYLYTLKPVYYFASRNREKDLNKIGQMAYDLHYKGESTDDLITFIENVLINKNDPLLSERKKFYQQYLLPPNQKSAAENIYDKICSYV
jgi:hypothetical protein